jgi:hypothetical protein
VAALLLDVDVDALVVLDVVAGVVPVDPDACSAACRQ